MIGIFGHLTLLSLLTVGSALAVVPELHRLMVLDSGLLTEAQFNAAIAIAQAAPGPNVLFIAVMGYQAAGLAGAAAMLGGFLLPAGLLAYAAARWGYQRRDSKVIRALKVGTAPIVIALLFSTSWILLAQTPGWRAVALSVTSALLVWRTRTHALALIGAGAAAGALGWIA